MKAFLKRRVELTVRGIKSIYWLLLNIGYRLNFFSVSRIPILINNFNRLAYPLQLIRFLEQCGFEKIIIIDNKSTYPPLLEYYRGCPHKVIQLDHNYGHLAFWKSGLYSKFKWDYFVCSDPDVLPVEECPKDFIVRLKSVLDKNSHLDKIGFGIKIDDLPATFRLKEKVIAYEKRYWQKEVQPGIYDAPIDTTFALYKPLSNLKNGEVYTLSAYRLSHPYMIRHLSWYVDSSNLSEEENYYARTSNASSSLVNQESGQQIIY